VVDIVVTGLSANSVPYLDALETQRSLHADVVAGRAPDTVLLLEHPSVYTAGKRTEASERPTDGTPVIDVDRGGKITWHGPGQLVGYPIVRLPDPGPTSADSGASHSDGTAVQMGIDVVAYVRRLESVMLAVLAELGIDAQRVAGRSGVWLRSDELHPGDKIGAIGIRVAEGVTMHGFALNCSNAFEAYDSIVACGIAGAGVTSISRELGRTVTPTDIIPLVSEQLAWALDFDRVGVTA
jgi:lipoyl(octanoyl) transferase